MSAGRAARPKNAGAGGEPLKNIVFLCASVPRWLKTGWLKNVQKKVKKKLTPLATSARFDLHTVKQQHTTTLQMKIKATLIAAATLAVGVISSQAQVYSQNIVGYVNVAVPPNAGFAYTENPLTNSANDLGTLFTNAPTNTKVWEFISGTWVPYTRRAAGNFTGGYDGHQILPGEGLLVQSPTGSAGFTNTFVGTVIVGTNIVSYLPNGNSAVGFVSPVGGYITTGLGYPATQNDKVWTYDNSLGFIAATKRSGATWTGSWATGTNGVTGSGEPFIRPGEAVFIQAAAAASGSWTNVLNVPQ
jgi:hypothetical protein